MMRLSPWNRRSCICIILYCLFIIPTSSGYLPITTTSTIVSSKRTLNHPQLWNRKIMNSIFQDEDDDNIKRDQRHEIFDILELEMENSFNRSNFASTNCWGRKPLLIRGAFRSQSTLLVSRKDDNYSNHDNSKNQNEEKSTPEALLWPTWDEVMELASDDDAESRLITHVPDDPLSWRLIIGPFDHDELMSLGSSNENNSNNRDSDLLLVHQDENWTIILNDVDRFHPPLFEFISEVFSFIPQWRKDDGQISLSNKGGGIGPHTDDYDVFLIQMTGERRWDIGRRTISAKEELDGLQEGLDVRILNFWEDEVANDFVSSFTLSPGDMMYLPPRFAHCGTALSDGCMTLSVGLRAPSAKEMLTKITEYVDSNIVDDTFVKRYTDPELLSGVESMTNVNEISSDVKSKAKHLLKDAFMSILENDDLFDGVFGQIVTQSNRVRSNYPISIDSLNEAELQSLGDIGDSHKCIESVLAGRALIYAAEGISWAYSIAQNNNLPYICRLFVGGKKWEICYDEGSVQDRQKIISLISKICSKKELTSKDLTQFDPIPKVIQQLLEDLVQEGYLYGIEI